MLPCEKPTICICKNKDADQLRVNAVKLISAFVFATRIVHFLFLNPKFQASSLLLWLCSLICVRPVRKPCWFSHKLVPYNMVNFLYLAASARTRWWRSTVLSGGGCPCPCREEPKRPYLDQPTSQHHKPVWVHHIWGTANSSTLWNNHSSWCWHQGSVLVSFHTIVYHIFYLFELILSC